MIPDPELKAKLLPILLELHGTESLYFDESRWLNEVCQAFHQAGYEKREQLPPPPDYIRISGR